MAKKQASSSVSIYEKQSLIQRIKKSLWGYTFISPFYILFAVFGLYPLLLSVYLSFTQWQGVGSMEFAGLVNFQLIPKDKLFWLSMSNGVIIFFLYVPIMLFLALVLAVILNSGRVKGFRFFRTLIFLPFITNMVAAGFAFRLLLDHQNGLFNNILGFVGLGPFPWLEDVWWARISLSLLIIWAWLGYNMVIMLAGLQTIPHDLTEAAMVDGATPIQAFFRITIPLMRPVILFTLITSTIGSFGLFAEVTILFNGQFGPANAALTPLIRIYNTAFRGSYQYGLSSAQAYTFFICIFLVTILQFRLNRDRE